MGAAHDPSPVVATSVLVTRGPDLSLLEQKKKESVGQLLFKCARLFNEQALARVNKSSGRPELRPAHTNLLPHIDFAGTRITEIARKLGITKQAVSQTIGDLEELGVVETFTDPSDGRAKLVRYTPKGAEGIQHGLRVLVDLERELTQSIGEGQMRALHSALLALESALTKSEAAPTPSKPKRKPR